MNTLPKGLHAYRRTPVFTESTVPAGLLKDHDTKPGVWGVIHVVSGRLCYSIPSRGESVTLSPERPGIVEQTVPHHVSPLGAVSFYVEFWR